MRIPDVDLLLLDIPTQINTERLQLRILQAGDGAMMSEAINASVDELCPWLSWVCDGQSIEESERYARKMAAKFIERSEFIFAILDRPSGGYMGNAGLHPRNHTLPSYEIGYWLATNYTGHGYMTEAVAALTTFAFDTLQAKRVELRCDPENKGSAAVAERTGYQLEGHLKKAMRNHAGELRDTLIYAQIRD